MNEKRYLFLLLVVLLLPSRGAVLAQVPADPNLVYVSVEVFRPGNVYVANLKKEDFRLLENRIEQTISFFQEDNQQSLYTLGYSSKNAVKDGNWRAIRVTVLKAGTGTVRHKQGYYARPLE